MLKKVPDQHIKGHWTPGPPRAEEHSEIITLTWWSTERFTSKPPKDNQRACVTKNRLVFKQTSKGTDEALAREGPRQGKDVAGLP